MTTALPEVVQLLQKLVQIPSVNPNGDPGTPHVGEKKMALFLKDYLTELGAEVELQQVSPDRPNVIARFKARKKSSSAVVLESHMDTVSVLGMTIPPFGGEVRDRRVWGRGACDTKGPMAAILTALKKVSQSGQWPETTDIYFVGAMGEETGNEGAIHLMESKYFQKRNVAVEFAVALEPTDMKIIHKHKGAMWLRISVKGRAGHSSKPELGENAIVKMGKVLDFIAQKLPAEYSKYHDAELGKPTFSVNVIRGGSKVNIIPDHCEIEMDHRSLPQESLKELLDLFAKHLPDSNVEVLSSRPGLSTCGDHPHVQKLAGAVEKHKKIEKVLGVAPWFADSGVFGEAGIPSVAFGPGSINQAHTKDEYIEIDELTAGEEIFQIYLKELR